MVFDKLCGLVERHFPELRKYVETARIFHFPARAHEVLPKQCDNVEWLWENFFLPFRCVAVEDTASVVILFDIEKDQRGMAAERVFIECLPMTQPSGEFCDSDKYIGVHNFFQDMAKTEGDCWMINKGRLQYIEATKCSWGMWGEVDFATLTSRDKIVIDYKEMMTFDYDFLRRTCLKNAGAAMEEIAYFNSPDRFILEETPLKVRHEAGKSQKILRSGDRPRYVILEPREIRQKLRLPPISQGGPKSPHDRRAHPHTFRSEKFKFMRGKTIIYPATWVGPSEATIGNKRYKILLDR